MLLVPGPVHGVTGERIPHLEYLADSRSLAILRLLEFEVDTDGQDELLRLIGRYFGTPHLQVFLTPVRSNTAPFAVGVDQNQRPWKRCGNLYTLVHTGRMSGDTLMPAANGEENAVMIWVCLAA